MFNFVWSVKRSGCVTITAPSLPCVRFVWDGWEDDAIKFEDKTGGVDNGKPVPIWICFGILAGTVGWTLPFVIPFCFIRFVDDPP